MRSYEAQQLLGEMWNVWLDPNNAYKYGPTEAEGCAEVCEEAGEIERGQAWRVVAKILKKRRESDRVLELNRKLQKAEGKDIYKESYIDYD